ncbi:PAS domain S-box protein [Natronomonas sp. LN261]|uniref:PAS domain S-box protein n=1 Tax=Natronomonas sp. LN261 TaxID=2750669 RepID=UPI0015EEF300
MTTTNDRIHVLYVDNEPAFDSTATELPRHSDDRITFYTATTPNEGLTLLNNHDIDCIVSEYDMPGRDGLSFLEAVRKEYPSLPFIFYTNEDLETVVPEALSAGSTDYVPKGSSTEHFAFLAQRITAATEQQRASDLKRIAALVRDIQSDLVQARTRDDIEASVCERLIDADPYVFAWIGGLDADTAHVTPRASAGEEAGYLDTAEITVDDSTTGQGPTGQAVRTRTSQVVQDISADPTYDPWREAALERSYQSSAAIPIEHDGTLYGVLNVYATYPNAFDADEQSLLEDLSDTIAHAHYHIQVRDQYDSQYQELFENAPVMMAFTREANGEPIIEDCNQRFADKLGYSREELQEQPLANVYTETSTERLLDKGGYQRSLDGEFTPKEREFITADDKRLVTLLQATPRRNNEGDVVGTHALYVDITDRKRAQSVLERAEAMDASMDGMSILNENNELIYLNQAHADIYGYDDPEALVGNTWRIFYEDDEVERLESEVLRALEDRGKWRGEATGRRKNGETFHQDLSLTETDNGGLICVVRDTTERKEREEEIKHLKERLELAVDGAELGVWDWDMTTDEVEFNEQWAQMLGYSLDEIESHLNAWEKRVHPDDVADTEAAIDSHITGETDYYDTENRLQTANGDWKWIRDVGKTVERDADGKPVRAVGIHIDIDEQKQRERKLRQFRKAVEQTAHIVYITDTEGTIEYVNPAFEEITGFSESEAVGQDPSILKSGEYGDGYYGELWETILSGEQWADEMFEEGADGEGIVLNQTISPITDEDGQPQKFVAVGQDTTKQKEYEQKIEDQRDNLEVLNQVVRHDIRNDMAVVSGRAELLKKHVEEAGKEDLEAIQDATESATELTKTARDLSDIMLSTEEDIEPVRLDQCLNPVVENVCAKFDTAMVTIDGQIPRAHVRGNELLEAVFRNLLQNAVVHNDKQRPEVRISTRIDEEIITVRVADNGPGIPDTQKETIFGKGEKGLDSPGTGLGLYLIRTLVEQYGGAVWVEDNDPEGSVFVVNLPLTETAATD